MLKILSVVSYNLFPPRSGGQKGILLFNKYLAKVSDLIVVTVKSNEPHFESGYTMLNVLSNSASRYLNAGYFFRLKKIIRDYQRNYLLLEHPYLGWLGILIKKSTGIKLVIHSHNIEGLRWRNLGKWWWKILWHYEKTTHRQADYNFFIQDDDREYAIKHFKLDPSKCTTITYGIELSTKPDDAEKLNCRERIKQESAIGNEDIIFLYSAALDYQPNLSALDRILEDINPLLLQTDFKYKILICGRGLPDRYHQLEEYKNKNVIYKGFVNDIAMYFKGADAFLNPVIGGGGIKTKLVEALGYNTRTISTADGSIGVNPEDTNSLLTIIPDNDWERFAEKMRNIEIIQKESIPPLFYEKFYWGNIVKKAVAFLGADYRN